jgi:hypothetical protein
MASLLFAVPLFAVAASADTPDFSGKWQIDPTQSHQPEDHNIALDITQNANGITFVRKYEEGGRGREVTSQFTCAPGGTSCNFDENGHKATVSLWYNGPELVILKTNGPKQDPTVEWHLMLDASGKTLTVKRENMAPDGKNEKLVFHKTDAVASSNSTGVH